jgi:outer membrane protein OmpA-like peptidoglycan-associated protein
LTYTLTAGDVGKSIEAIYAVPLTTGMGFSGLAVGLIEATGSCESSAPAPTPTSGPAVKTSIVPKEITIIIPASPNAAPIANVPCEAADGEKLKSCTVDMTAPMAALLGQGDGVRVQQARAGKTFVAGKATLAPKGGSARIVVPVKINANGRKALKRNITLKVTVGIRTVTLTDRTSSGSAQSEMRLPKQVLSPQAGIFGLLSTTLNADGRKFVKRLAALLPTTPRRIVCTGYADNTGVPGDNRWLGERRARALCDALKARGIEAKVTRIVSKGATSPRDDNSTAKGRERNRRANVTITY